MSDSSVASKATRGAFSLLGRQFVLFPVGVVTGFILARLLTPAEFGTYASATFVVMSAGALLEFGIGQIIVQQREEPSTQQLRSIFTAQFIVYGLAFGLLCLLAPLAADALHMKSEGAWVIRAVSLHMLMGLFGTNSTLLLERRMEFDSFARIDIANVLLDRTLTLVLAFLNYGVWSWVVGGLVAMGVRIIMLWFAAPWSLGLALDWAILRRALRYGLTLQGTYVSALVRENLNTVVGGGGFGPQAVGFLNWGQNLPYTCANWLLKIVERVSFPAFARMQVDEAERQSFLALSMRVLNLVTFPALFALVPLGTHLVTFCYGEKWRPGLFALACFVVRTPLTHVTSMLTGYFNATDRAALSLRVATFWTVIEVALALALVPFYGFNGVALACALGPILPAGALLVAAHREARLPYGRVFGVPIFSGLVTAGVAAIAATQVTSLGALIAAVVLCGGVALTLGILFERALIHRAVADIEARLRQAFREPVGTEPLPASPHEV